MFLKMRGAKIQEYVVDLDDYNRWLSIVMIGKWIIICHVFSMIRYHTYQCHRLAIASYCRLTSALPYLANGLSVMPFP